MSWTSLDEDDTTSSSNADEEFVEPDNLVGQMNGLEKSAKRPKGESQYSRCEHGSGSQTRESNSGVYSSQDQSSPSNPFVQEPSPDNEINLRKECPSHQELKNLLSIKDDSIRTLQKLINGQREQLYHFLNMSLKEETLLELKKTCRETEALNRNENICMAVDKFKYDNDIPTEQTLVREDISKTLLKIERLMRHQTKLVKSMESGKGADEKCEETENSVEISCYRSEDQLTDVQRLLESTQQLQKKIHILKIQLKKLALIEQERIDLVERVYSMPPDQRQYYAHLAVIEREKIQLRLEIDQLSENYKDLKQNCCFLEKTEQELSKCIDSKIADLDLNKIKPGLETHLELMEMVERGELSLITMTKDEKGRMTGDFIKLYKENAEISERLKDFDKVARERDDLKRQIEVLVENCLRLQSEVRALRLASKTDELMEQLRLACLEREQLRTELDRLTKKASGVSQIPCEPVEKTILRETKLHELGEVKPAHVALLDKSGKHPDIVGSLDKDTPRNMHEQLEYMAEVEKQRKPLILDISRYRYALLRQEDEVKDLVVIVEKLMEQIKTLKMSSGVNPIEGVPEGPDIIPSTVLNPEEERRLEIIRNRIRQNDSKIRGGQAEGTFIPMNSINLEKNTFLSSVRSFLGLDNSLAKIADH